MEPSMLRDSAGTSGVVIGRPQGAGRARRFPRTRRPRFMSQKIMGLTDDLRRRPIPAPIVEIRSEVETTGRVCLENDKIGRMAFQTRPNH